MPRHAIRDSAWASLKWIFARQVPMPSPTLRHGQCHSKVSTKKEREREREGEVGREMCIKSESFKVESQFPRMPVS